MNRNKNWYSVIRYCPSTLKGEIINVGIIMFNSENVCIGKYMVDSTDQKIRVVGRSSDYKLSKQIFLSQEDYLNYSSKELILSEPTFILGDPKKLIKKLVEIYI